MTIYYIDPENGNDALNGQSFANRKKYSAPAGDNDEVRFIRSPAPTSLGNGSWAKDSTYNHNELIDTTRRVGGGTVTIDGQSAGNPTTVSRSNHGLSTGDAIFFNTVNPSSSYAYAGPHLITKVDDDNFTLDGTENAPDTDSVDGVNAYNLNPFCVRLASSPIKNIICYQGLDGGGDKDWTIAQGIGGRNTAFMQSGYDSARTFKPGNDAIGKVAHVQLDNALDLSGYQQISLKYYWTYASGGQDPDADIFSLRLCSDTGGNTTVHTVPIKPPPGDDQDRWGWYTHDFGTNLNSSIQSIALHLDKESEHANLQIEIDNVIACKAKSADDSLHLGSLIGKGNTFMSNWYPIMAIVDKIVLIENQLQTEGLNTDNRTRALLETTETVTTYKQECFARPEYFSGSEDSAALFDGFSNASNVTISGGWNSTDMSSQDTNAGTMLSAQNVMYSQLSLTECNQVTISNLGFVRGFYGTYWSNTNRTGANISNCQVILPQYGMLGTIYTTYNNCKFYGTTFARVTASVSETNSVLNNCTFTNSNFRNLQEGKGHLTFTNCTIQGAINRDGPLIEDFQKSTCIFANCTITKQKAFAHGEDYEGHNSFTNCAITDVIDILESLDADDSIANDEKPYLSFINYNNTANDHRLYYTNCYVTSDSSVTQSGSGFSWKYHQQIVNEQSRDSLGPLRFKLAEVYVTANSQVTATIYARRSNAATDDYVALAALAHDNAVVGISTDVKSSALSAAADTWQQLTLNFTPTKEGVATITALMSTSNTSYNVWIDTLEIA